VLQEKLQKLVLEDSTSDIQREIDAIECDKPDCERRLRKDVAEVEDFVRYVVYKKMRR